MRKNQDGKAEGISDVGDGRWGEIWIQGEDGREYVALYFNQIST